MGELEWLFQPVDGPGEAVAAIEEVGLISTAEVAVEVGDSAVVGAFEVEY